MALLKSQGWTPEIQLARNRLRERMKELRSARKVYVHGYSIHIRRLERRVTEAKVHLEDLNRSLDGDDALQNVRRIFRKQCLEQSEKAEALYKIWNMREGVRYLKSTPARLGRRNTLFDE